MALYLETEEIESLVTRILDGIAATITSQTGEEGIELRYKIGILRSDIMGSLRDETFSAELLACFNATKDAGASLASLVAVLEMLFAEDAQGDVPKMIVNQAIIFCLATEAQIITATEFKSRDDAESVMNQMRAAFDIAREIISELEDPLPYRTLLSLAGSLTSHLAYSALKLPQIIDIKLPTAMPALVVSQYVYQTADRWEELVDDNKIIHPAFVRRTLRGLSQ